MDKIFNDYLQKIERYLKPLPLSERMDILKEISSQMIELETAGLGQTEIINRLGSPKKLAKSYLDLLINDEKSVFRYKLLAICAYYTLAGFTGVMIISILMVCAVVFIFCGFVTPLISLFKLIDYIFNLNLPYMEHVGVAFGSVQLSPIWSFLISLLLAAGLLIVGWGCWKLLVTYIKGMRLVKCHLSSDERKINLKR